VDKAAAVEVWGCYRSAVDDDSLVALAAELVTRRFPDGATDGSDWLEGLPQSSQKAHFAPIAMSESLYETPADYDGRIGELYEEVYNDFLQRRQRAVDALTARWGTPRLYSFQAEYDRVLANDDSVSSLEYDLAMFTGGQPFSAWQRDGRIVGLLLGQMDKEFPILLTLAVIARPPS